jgi:branched-chain amino acid transport system permease protein
MTQSIIQALVDGLLNGGVYATIAVGLSLAFGLMRIVNWSHGEFLMLGMYIVFLLVQATGIDPYLTIIVSGTAMFILGYLLQKYIYNDLLDKSKSREPMSVLLFTLALGMILSNGALIVFGKNPIAVQTRYMGQSIKLDWLIVSIPRLISFLIALLLTFGLYLFVNKTETGRAMRATSQNREVAQLMGINHKAIYCLAFAMGLGLVGLSGSLLVPYLAVSTAIGTTFGNKSFIIVVLGGKGSIEGALVGGLIVGIIEKVGALFWTDAYAQLIVFFLFVVILFFKPNGLLNRDKG